MKKSLALFFCAASVVNAGPIDPTTTEPKEQKREYINWHNADPTLDHIQGVSTEQAYGLLKNKKSRTVRVAIIDSGIDINHEDLKGKIWTNSGEIPGNGIDDDKNGYVDDIHGWNFIGGADGKNVNYETLELTRLYRKYQKQFDGRSADQISASEKHAYEAYQAVKQEYDRQLEEARRESESIENIASAFQYTDGVIKNHLGKAKYTLADLEAIQSDDEMIMKAADFLKLLLRNKFSVADLDQAQQHYRELLHYNLNLEFNPRDIVGDNPEENSDVHYGNADVIGVDPEHGTHVAGIVGAQRGNGLGLDGIAENVEIMVIRAVPSGDERDKDVANAIRYAVDNGAQIVNMSFGKSYSPHKQWVDEAVRYAESHGVLLVHAAGNDAENNDVTPNFPTNAYSDNGPAAQNWITVGATSRTQDLDFVANFSNYGNASVDVFAPGVDIYSTLPHNEYDLRSGTSMASPVVTGVAALVWSYYPELSAEQLKEVLVKSSLRYRGKVYRPDEEGHKKKVKFKKLSTSGGVVNAYEAVKLAEELTSRTARK
ncbi:Subtilase family protein [Catalinimonas alkaloidigena]|uniref:Subtilase family protein n=1 Tax=Catalinimonas alkaloidigena TaxID=1075417 RepID=A0A1G8WYJ9_9BACT|nr:S8 family peptidase [Catalinimonas alkaloidigena]SDJ83284.1 Subtilase family protein [Catalinimonas alkaloidigena]